MKFEINITKNRFWALVAMSVFLMAVLVFAAVDKPNPGHDVSELSGLEEWFNSKDLVADEDNCEFVTAGRPTPYTSSHQGLIDLGSEGVDFQDTAHALCPENSFVSELHTEDFEHEITAIVLKCCPLILK